MRGKTIEHYHAKHEDRHRPRRARGGNVEKDGIEDAGGNPYVHHEAKEDRDGAVTERKRGGKAKRKRGGMIDGKHAKHRLDRKAGGRAMHHHEHEHHDRHEHEHEHKHIHRAKGGSIEPGRGHEPRRALARGGRAGSDLSPLSSANRTSAPGRKPDTEEGGLSKRRGGPVGR
jgi:hypothetical protein